MSPEPGLAALQELIGTENFEERFDEPGGRISRQVLAILQDKFRR